MFQGFDCLSSWGIFNNIILQNRVEYHLILIAAELAKIRGYSPRLRTSVVYG